MKVRELLDRGKRKLEETGLESAELESRRLYCALSGDAEGMLFMRYNDEASEKTVSDYESFLRRRSEGEPLQYILGSQEFMGFDFRVSPGVLIPRPETELLVEQAVSLILTGRLTNFAGTELSPEEDVEASADSGAETMAGADSDAPAGPDGKVLAGPDEKTSAGPDAKTPTGPDAKVLEGPDEKTPAGPEESGITFQKDDGPVRCLDLGCGSGAIGLSVAALTESEVTLTDASEDALQLTWENAEGLGVLERVRLLQGDLFGPVRGETFDILLSNPPYIPSDVIPTLDLTVRGYEPVTALDGGTDGLDFYRRIAGEAPDLLLPGGILMMEIGYDQKKAVLSMLRETGAFSRAICLKDLAGLDRMIIAKKKNNR
ncbi:MAG: N5-glutamine methyltransferase family protein [Anaerovoracaceae bacterium]|jgi:release factor glutamine methyltransferase